MKKVEPSILSSKLGIGEIFDAWLVITNSDLEEGRGSDVILSVQPTLQEAKEKYLGVGVFGTDGKITKAKVVNFDNKTYLMVEGSFINLICKCDECEYFNLGRFATCIHKDKPSHLDLRTLTPPSDCPIRRKANHD